LEPKNREFNVIIIPPIQKIKNKIINIFPFSVVCISVVDVERVSSLFIVVFTLGVNEIVL